MDYSKLRESAAFRSEYRSKDLPIAEEAADARVVRLNMTKRRRPNDATKAPMIDPLLIRDMIKGSR